MAGVSLTRPQDATSTTVMPGQIGIRLKTTSRGPVLVSTGKLSGRIPIGWLLVGVDEVEVGTQDAPAVATLLKERNDQERTLRWREDEAAEAEAGLSCLEVPAGRLGIILTSHDDGPKIYELAADSPLAAATSSTRMPWPRLAGLHLLEVDGIDVSKCGADEAAAVLKQRSDSSRHLKLYNTSGESGAQQWIAELSQIVVVRG